MAIKPGSEGKFVGNIVHLVVASAYVNRMVARDVIQRGNRAGGTKPTTESPANSNSSRSGSVQPLGKT